MAKAKLVVRRSSGFRRGVEGDSGRYRPASLKTAHARKVNSKSGPNDRTAHLSQEQQPYRVDTLRHLSNPRRLTPCDQSAALPLPT